MTNKEIQALILNNQIVIMGALWHDAAKDESKEIHISIIDTKIAISKLCENKVTKEVKSESTEDLQVRDVFHFWNNCKTWGNHRNISDFVPSIKKVLNNYCLLEITEAIENYAIVRNSDDHYFSHLWTLKDFLNRGFLNFIKTADPLNNYRIKNNGRKTTNNPSVSSQDKSEFKALFNN